MENGTEKNTQLLEACRAEMERLAVQGEDVLQNAVVQAERQTKACTAEWNQAQKTVALTTAQHETVAAARSTGQEKLASAISEEEDARIAAETVQRMIEDAHTLNCMANSDTARILQKAGDVLDETAKRAVSFYHEKKLQREEVEAALRRLDATEKAVLYTVAKAERRASEKMLLKLIAERRQEVCAAEYESIRVRSKRDDLLAQKEDVVAAINSLHDALQQAKQEAEEREATRGRLQSEAAENVAIVEAENEENLHALAEQSSAAEQEKQRFTEDLAAAEAFYADCEAEYETAARLSEEAKRNSADTALSAQQEQETAIHEMESRLAELRQESEMRREAYSDALSQREAAEAERMRLQQVVEQCHKKAEDARAEQQAAQDAAQTAYRLAENATKIRESISSESSELLLHAQQVLIEAANAAQKLKEEKELLRKAAEQECALILERVGHAAQTLEKVCCRVDEADVACQEIERQLVDEAAKLERERHEWATRTAAAIEQAERACEQAAHNAEEKRQVAAEALAELDKMRAGLQQAEELLVQLGQRKEEAAAKYAEQLAAIQRQLDGELQRLADRATAAAAAVQQQEEDYASKQEVLSLLCQEIEQTSDLLREMNAHVDEIVAVGVLDIISAEEVVGGSRYKEEAARRAAEEVVSYLGGYFNQSDRFVSLQETEEAGTADDLDDDDFTLHDLEQEIGLQESLSAEQSDEERIADLETEEELGDSEEADAEGIAAAQLMAEDAPLDEEDMPTTDGAEEDSALFSPAADEELPESASMAAGADEDMVSAAEEGHAVAADMEYAESGEIAASTDDGLAAEAQDTESAFAEKIQTLDREPSFGLDLMAGAVLQQADEPVQENPLPEQATGAFEEDAPLIEDEAKQEEISCSDEKPACQGESLSEEELSSGEELLADDELLSADDGMPAAVQPAEEGLLSDLETSPANASLPDGTELLGLEQQAEEDSITQSVESGGEVELLHGLGDAGEQSVEQQAERNEAVADAGELLADEDAPDAEDEAESEELLDLFGGLMPEEIEYTQRLARLGDTLISQVMEQEENAIEQPEQPKEEYHDWMANLTRSLSEEGEASAAEAEPAPEINSAPLLQDDMQEIQEVLLRTSEPKPAEEEIDEDELRLSILNVMDETPQTPPKKRRFPFF